ncbi:uncharacterized protein LOC107269538 [Cephus cinctus]|uniref:Uncharacterized protein LOC107269538 n=1 Tax=Cephus cinctus TaxID=211228 RepID=A0AAJ7C0Q4_CEPCN|nr:uncharacterized protein LOC107269538 [Cephus cinctus]
MGEVEVSIVLKKKDNQLNLQSMCDGVHYCTYMCSELSTSVRRQAGQVPYVEWLGSEALVGGMDDVIYHPQLQRVAQLAHPSRAAFFTPKQSHENERNSAQESDK